MSIRRIQRMSKRPLIEAALLKLYNCSSNVEESPLISANTAKNHLGIHTRDRDGYSSIMLATMRCDIDLVRSLLSGGANVQDKLPGYGHTPLILVSSLNGNLEITDLLLSHGANVHDRDSWGTTSIMIAAEMGYTHIVKFLLSKGADLLECRISDGYSPLFLAAYNGHVDVVELLLFHGADLYEGRWKDGATALEIALENRHLSVVKMLLTKGANANNLTHSREACEVLKYNNEFKKCLQLWPAIMGILVLQTFGDLGADTLLDLCHFASHSHSE